MHSAPLPPHEARRLAVLHDPAVFDAEPDPAFDALARAAALLTGCPMALVMLVDGHRQFFKGAHGLPCGGLPRSALSRDGLLRAHATDGSVVVVSDLRQDPRHAGDPLVVGQPWLRFYAGAPLKVRDVDVGILCVFDTEVRGLDDAGVDALAALARATAELVIARQRMPAADTERERLLDFARASGDWMWETDAALNHVWLSETYESVTGLSVASKIGQPIFDAPLLDPDGTPLRRGGWLHQLLSQHAPFSRAVTEEPRAHGTMVVSRSAVPMTDADGRFSGYRGTARDITEQVEATRRSRTHDRLLRKLSSQVPGVIFQFRMSGDAAFDFPYVSDGLRDLLGIGQRVDGLVRDPAVALRMVHPDDRVGFVESIKASASSLLAWQREYRIIRRDGSLRWLETRAMPERQADGATVWHGFTADITARKETELALRRFEERWEMAADAAGIGLAELDLATGLMNLDRRACVNHGLPYPACGLTLTDWLATVDPVDREPLRTKLEHAAAAHTTLEARYVVHRGEHSATLEITARGRHDSHGRTTSLVGTCRDVTAQREVERLQRDKDAAERANRAKSEFLSRVSHEFRTPLNGILGFAQVMSLDRTDALSPAQQRRLDSLARAGRHLLDLINDVLDLTRIESEDFSLKPVGVDARRALADCLALIQPLAEAAGVHLPEPSDDVRPVWVRADPRALEQVLMNLLSNAIKYNRPAGSVSVDIGTAPGDFSRVRIAIRDQGRGIGHAQLASLFQPFNRLGAENGRIEGSGLGLVISQRLVDAMAGKLLVQSTPGTGSIFTVDLPAGGPDEAPAPQSSTQATIAAAPGPAKRKVLYIEDEPLNAVLMEEVFRTHPQWTLTVADDGASGLQHARAGRPDLVLIDMNLPDMNGLEVISALRNHDATRELRCIALSADAMREQIDAALSAGFDDYWTKPIDVPKVLADLARLLADGAPATARRDR